MGDWTKKSEKIRKNVLKNQKNSKFFLKKSEKYFKKIKKKFRFFLSSQWIWIIGYNYRIPVKIWPFPPALSTSTLFHWHLSVAQSVLWIPGSRRRSSPVAWDWPHRIYEQGEKSSGPISRFWLGEWEENAETYLSMDWRKLNMANSTMDRRPSLALVAVIPRSELSDLCEELEDVVPGSASLLVEINSAEPFCQKKGGKNMKFGNGFKKEKVVRGQAQNLATRWKNGQKSASKQLFFSKPHALWFQSRLFHFR